MARVVFLPGAFEELLRHPNVAADLTRRAEAVAGAAGGLPAGFVAASGQGATRARAAVITATGRGIRTNARDNTLLRCLDAARR